MANEMSYSKLLARTGLVIGREIAAFGDLTPMEIEALLRLTFDKKADEGINALSTLKKLVSGSETPANRYIALGNCKLDLNVSRVALTPAEDMLVSRLMKR